MSPSSPSPVLQPDTAVLLVLLPLVSAGEASSGTHSNASIRTLQGRLGPGIRVLRIDEASHPAVVRSFGTPELPACVLVRQGVELWRQHGLPEDEDVFSALLEAAHAQ
ncbi:thioredoxin [Hymenobacter radiodurans]|uniref:thioredoxin n=1 Tax=Hymenobacter radiodurans TaxID=2496028 RepID=UPI001058D1F7|nr:thioredoxin [Hymenobacter radiodurans]